MSRALVLMYHLVDTPRSAMERRFCTPPADFANQMAYLAESGYTAVSLVQLCDAMEGKAPMPAKPVHITFDDGFTCVLEHAAPILEDHRFPATMFALSDKLGSVNDWMTCRGYPERTILSADGLKSLESAGFTIGSHTRTHARLTDLSPEDAVDEITVSRSRLEEQLGHAIDFFAYPFGAFNQSVRDIAERAGYRAACSTRSGFNRVGEDPYLIRRIDVFGTDRLWQFKQKLNFGTNDASLMYPLRYAARRVLDRFSR
jgi:peptidoglycan/xylan/chitin deacetylase (PgdA/CDA1 family)